jgi:aromatic ring-cleaving dioxygenase
MFATLIERLDQNREELSILIHVLSGDAWEQHTPSRDDWVSQLI